MRDGRERDGRNEWARLTWPEARERLAGCRAALLPVGSTEAHGPHLPLDTDVVIAEETARRAAARLGGEGVPALVLPALPYGVTDFARDFEGTLSVPAEVVTALIAAVGEAVARAGAPLLCVVNAHLEPAHIRALDAGCRFAEERAPGFRAILPDVTRRRWSSRLTEEFRSGACHAGRYETSLVMAARPGSVPEEAVRDLPPVPISLSQAIREGRRSFREAGGDRAYFGWPAEATAEEGHETFDRLAAIVAEAVREALADPAADVNRPPGSPLEPR